MTERKQGRWKLSGVSASFYKHLILLTTVDVNDCYVYYYIIIIFIIFIIIGNNKAKDNRSKRLLRVTQQNGDKNSNADSQPMDQEAPFTF